MAHRATIQDLAEKSAVSVSTIDRIMNGRAKVREATATRVLTAAEELQFYALPALRERLKRDKPTVRLGFLLQQSQRSLYRTIGDALIKAGQASAEPVEVVIEFMEDLTPEAVSAQMLRLGREVQALAVVSADHARIARAIEALRDEGVRTYGLISELTAASEVGYFGLENWKAGRTAAWALTGLAKRPGRIAILVGNHRYRCQESNESGFRSYCREHAQDFTILEPMQTFEDRAIARDVTDQILIREPDLVGLYVAGGGMPGVLEALRASDRAEKLVVVGHELTEHTRGGLIDGILSLVVGHPITRMANEAISVMASDVRSLALPSKRMFGLDLFTPESI
jgi:LacI family transcriptional regulator